MYTTKNRLPYASCPLYERPRLRPVTFVLNLDHFRREMLRPNMLFLFLNRRRLCKPTMDGNDNFCSFCNAR